MPMAANCAGKIHLVPGRGHFQLSAEIALIAACCRWPRSAARNEAIARAAAAPINWQRFREMAAKHRVEGLIHDGLLAAGVEMPADVQEALHGRSMHIAVRSLVLADTTLAIGKLFRSAGLPALFFKGSSLEMLAYGKLGLKSACDIDVIVNRADLVPAGEVLQDAGWTQLAPPAGTAPHLRERYFDYAKDATFGHQAQGIRLELHHALGWDEALEGVGASSPTQTVELLPGKTLPTFATEDLFIHLAVHGTVHHWSRLKWLADFGALLARLPAAEVAQLHDAACRRGAGRFTGQALLMSHHLLGTELSRSLRAVLERDRRIVRWCAGSIAMIERAAGRSRFGDGLKALMLDLQLRSNWRAKARVLRYLAINPADMVRRPLPESLFFLYYLHYVGRIALALVRRAFGREAFPAAAGTRFSAIEAGK
jgi:hypothetical protein